MDSINVNGGQAATYTYNPLGQRVVKELANGDKEIYHYDEAGQLIAVVDDAGNTLREYIYWDGKQVAMVRGGNIYYIHNDHLNTPQVITDASQQVVWMANYEPFGKLAANQTNSIEVYSRFPGQYLDSETGLYYNYFRDYDPSIGRYIESDPIGLGGGINTYGYVDGNPVNRIDPTGQFAIVIPALPYIAEAVAYVGSAAAAAWAAHKVKENLTKEEKQQAANEAAGPPPGNCNEAEHSALQNDVQMYCKNNGAQSCSVADSCSTLEAKLEINTLCAQARDKIRYRCYAGGDIGHIQQAEGAWNAVKNCTAALGAKNCNADCK